MILFAERMNHKLFMYAGGVVTLYALSDYILYATFFGAGCIYEQNYPGKFSNFISSMNIKLGNPYEYCENMVVSFIEKYKNPDNKHTQDTNNTTALS